MAHNAHHRFSLVRFNRGRRCISDEEKRNDGETAVSAYLIFEDETFRPRFARSRCWMWENADVWGQRNGD